MATAYVLVNGSPTNEFKMERGLCQGDPLSPFIFLIAAEGLHVLMNALMEKGMYAGYGAGAQNVVNISHLQFNDDMLFVGIKILDNVHALKVVLIWFEPISGLKVNFHKSMVFVVKFLESWLHEVMGVMNCKHGRLPFLYLGIHIGA